MLAKPLQDSPRRSWVLEPKFDGHRVIVQKENGVLSVHSRTGKSQLGKLPELEAAFAQVPFDFTLDGEMVAVNSLVELGGQQVPIVDFSGTASVMGSGASEAVRKQKAEGNLTLVVFDCLASEGVNITSFPDFKRRQFAATIVDLLSNHTDFIMLTPRWDTWDDSYFTTLVAAGGEGVMLKNPAGKYRPGKRSSDWLKMKATETADVVIMGYEPGKNGFSGSVGAVIFGQYRDGKLMQRSQCSGMDWAQRTEFTNHPDRYIGQVMEIRFFGRIGPEQSFRHPNFVCIRTDKTARECEWE